MQGIATGLVGLDERQNFGTNPATWSSSAPGHRWARGHWPKISPATRRGQRAFCYWLKDAIDRVIAPLGSVEMQKAAKPELLNEAALRCRRCKFATNRGASSASTGPAVNRLPATDVGGRVEPRQHRRAGRGELAQPEIAGLRAGLSCYRAVAATAQHRQQGPPASVGLHNSGAMEQDARIVVFVHGDEVDKSNFEPFRCPLRMSREPRQVVCLYIDASIAS